MADQAAPPNIGNETFLEFCARPEWDAMYGNPDGDDTFSSLNVCTNAVWARAVRDTLKQINEAFACRHITPLSIKATSGGTGKDWRPSDDDAYAIVSGDFGAAGVHVPTYFFNFNLDNTNQGSGPATVIEQSDQTGSRVYTYVRVQGRPGASIGSTVIGMRTFFKAVGFNSTSDLAITGATSLFASTTVRIPEWPQSNNRIVLLAIKQRQADDETGGADRINFEFGLGPGDQLFPGNSDRAYSLYVRWRDAGDAEDFALLEMTDDSALGHGVGITPGYEWTLGFHRYEKDGVGTATWAIDFYINGQFVKQVVDLSTPLPGNDSAIRFLVGAGNDGKQFCGGPVRNVSLSVGHFEPTIVAPYMTYVYQKGAGYI